MTHPNQPRSPDSDKIIRGIMLAVFAWGAILALGAFLFGINQETGNIGLSPNPLRGLITLVFVVGFLGFWKWMLSRRARN